MIALYIFLGIIVLTILIVIAVNTKGRSASGSRTSITDRRGKQGEEYAKKYLYKHIVGSGDTLLSSLLLKTNRGRKCEVDLVLLSTKGIFCIEVKNWVGKIEGDDYSEEWKQIYDDDYLSNRTHRNPVIQNENHCEILENLLSNRYQVNNIVLFNRIEYPSSIHSAKVFDLYSFRNHFFGLPDNVLTNGELEKIYLVLEKYQACEEELEAYRESIKSKYSRN